MLLSIVSVMLLRVSEIAFLTARTEEDSFSCFLSEPKGQKHVTREQFDQKQE